MKYGASLLMAGGIVATHLLGMAALTLVLPADTALSLPVSDNSLQLSLTIAFITLLISASSISAALSDKKLQSKEHDLRRVNVLLSQLDQARVSLQQAAHYDALTNLVNRRGFNQVFAERLAEQTANDGMLAVMFLDIDHFKRINDSLGHDAGDELLKVIAAHIKTATRSQDVVARFGGDEFCILTALHSRDEARHLAQRIMQKMKEPIDLAGRRMVMTTSIGISVFPDDGRSCDELLKNADLALYQSKGCGRNNLNFFNSNLKPAPPSSCNWKKNCASPCSKNVACASTTNRFSTFTAARWPSSRPWCAGNIHSTGCSARTASSALPKPTA